MKTQSRSGGLSRTVERLSGAITAWTGGTQAFLAAFGLIVLWLALGPAFHFSDTWQLGINTTTTIATFLMVFLIQRAQNKGAKATALKLNELIAAVEGASNRLIDLEDLSEDELEALQRHFRKLVEMARTDASLTRSHTVEEAGARHHGKLRAPGGRAAPARHGGAHARARGNGRGSRRRGPRHARPIHGRPELA